MTRTLLLWLVAVICGTAIAVPAAGVGDHTQAPQARVDYNSGAYLFKALCASCHGESGDGVSQLRDMLKKDPGDLRLLAQRNGGMFPRDRVREAIDGRTLAEGHTRAGMPVWGTVLRSTEPTERDVAARIDALVTHLEALQIAKSR